MITNWRCLIISGSWFFEHWMLHFASTAHARCLGTSSGGGKREAHILGKKMHLLVCDQNADLFVEHPWIQHWTKDSANAREYFLGCASAQKVLPCWLLAWTMLCFHASGYFWGLFDLLEGGLFHQPVSMSAWDMPKVNIGGWSRKLHNACLLPFDYSFCRLQSCGWWASGWFSECHQRLNLNLNTNVQSPWSSDTCLKTYMVGIEVGGLLCFRIEPSHTYGDAIDLSGRSCTWPWSLWNDVFGSCDLKIHFNPRIRSVSHQWFEMWKSSQSTGAVMLWLFKHREDANGRTYPVQYEAPLQNCISRKSLERTWIIEQHMMQPYMWITNIYMTAVRCPHSEQVANPYARFDGHAFWKKQSPKAGSSINPCEWWTYRRCTHMHTVQQHFK